VTNSTSTASTTTRGLPGTGATILGYPRMGPNRALKKFTERYWAGELDGTDLLRETRNLRRQTLRGLRDAGLTEVPCADFSLYDHVLDTACMVGAVPERFRPVIEAHGGARPGMSVEGLDSLFAMARGTDDVAPLEMTKWFDTNYHYLVPEVGPATTFTLDTTKPIGELILARAEGIAARPVILGPVTFLLLAKPAPGAEAGFDPLCLLDRLLPVYAELLGDLQAAGASWVQLDEPALVQDQPPGVLAEFRRAYETLSGPTARPKIVLATYFGTPGEFLPVLRDLPVEGVSLDLTRSGKIDLGALASAGTLPGKRLLAGVVDGRNVWANDLRASLSLLAALLGIADEVVVSTSCSLLHVPLDATLETGLDREILPWLAFARQKVDEVVTLARGLAEGADAVAAELEENRAVLASRASSPVTRDPAVRSRAAAVTPDDARRATPYARRAELQQERLRLPVLPTTTIGSFPQTAAVRSSRAGFRKGEIDEASYLARMRAEIQHVITLQEKLGLDVLVHGEPERNDMVQYFAEQLDGFVALQHGWVQSYGTRYVRPPVVVGDVSRPAPMTVEWATYAQSLTARPVKGMITGPVTMLKWSFVRDDQPVSDTARQVALALRDEVTDLESAGIAVIQVDEPALREGLPLRASDRADYLAWATSAFRLATGGVRDETQIHTHMCYAEFGDILEAIIDLDTDVISMEAARSHMSVAADLAAVSFPSGVGPGVYDIHSPRVPDVEEVIRLLRTALGHLPAGRLWVNPDCGLKTRTEDEVIRALTNLTAAAATLR
jgi:5-methyltetrahydropteroyltriglutamate--homocysteine methyltransferase